jgi:hypothetical protein
VIECTNSDPNGMELLKNAQVICGQHGGGGGGEVPCSKTENKRGVISVVKLSMSVITCEKMDVSNTF